MGSKPRRKKGQKAPRPKAAAGKKRKAGGAVALMEAPAPSSAEASAEEALLQPVLELPVETEATAPEAVEPALDPSDDIFPQATTAWTKPAEDDQDASASAPSIPYLVDPVEAFTWDRVAADAAEPSAEAEAAVEPEPWVDLILEPTTGLRVLKTPPTERVGKRLAPTVDALRVPEAPRSANAPRRRPAPPVKPSAKAAAPTPIAQGSRWWIVAPAALMLAVIAYVNRPTSGHDPLPPGLLGTWTTEFWRFKQQTLEFRPDTVVLRLTNPSEGRYPITKVETVDVGRETTVTVTYRMRNGEERSIAFQADKEPTTALRFHSHPGLVWTRPAP